MTSSFDRFDYAVWTVLAGLALMITGLLATGDQVGTQVALDGPAAQGDIGGSGPIGLVFSEAMVSSTVEARFTTDPPINGSWRWDATRAWFYPSAGLLPGTLLTAHLAGGAAGTSGRVTQANQSWPLKVRQPFVAYLAFFGSDTREIFRVPITGGTPVQVTNTGGHVYDFDISPDGELLAYSAVNDIGGADLWLIARAGGEPRQLLKCDNAFCTMPSWSPDGEVVAFSREPPGLAPGSQNGMSRVWTVDVKSSAAQPVYQDSQVIGYSPLFAPRGRRLALFDGNAQQIRLLDLVTREETNVSTLVGNVGAWSPGGDAMMFTDMNTDTDNVFVMVRRAEFASEAVTTVLGAEPNEADYTTPAWSPDGQTVAVGARVSGGGASKQISLYRPDGTLLRRLTDDTAYTFSSYSWDPSSRILVVQRFLLKDPGATPEVVVWPVAPGSSPTLVAREAVSPEWWP